MKKIIDHVAEHLLDLAISALLSAVVTYFSKNNPIILNYLKDERTNVIVAAFFLYMLVCFSIFRSLRIAAKYKFRIRSLEIIMEYHGDQVRVRDVYSFSTYRVFQKQMYTRRTWFSGESFTFKAKPKGYKAQFIRKIGNTHEYYIVFPTKFSFWQKTREFKTDFIGSNKSRQYENFYWYEVICPVDKLIFDIRIPDNMCAQSAKMKVFQEYEDEDGNEKKEIKYNRGFKYEIQHPKIGYSYKLEWQWVGEERLLREGK